MNSTNEIIAQLNLWGKQGRPFVFLIDFLAQKPMVFLLSNPQNQLFWEIPGYSNPIKKRPETRLEWWDTTPVSFEQYSLGFREVIKRIHNGDTYLLNFTQPTQVETNLSLEEIYLTSSSAYKIYLKDEFVCFSPETFVRIENGKIFSYPMKGTIDADIENARELVLNDSKELAEHNTIVDLIRNDLSLVAENVTVDKFRYLSHIKTNNKNLLQVSSKISGDLPANYYENIGDILFKMLPAGSVTGAPKPKTVKIIRETENYDRGYYTGVFGVFDGRNLESCVLIRYIENQNGQLIYKSGGGITFLSDVQKEYDEMLKKVYLPLTPQQ